MKVDELEHGDTLVIRKDLTDRDRHALSEHGLGPGDKVEFAFYDSAGVMLRMGQMFATRCFRLPSGEEKQTYCTLTIRPI